jgi:alginate O-acetyltransferase complex protein AlgI
MMGFRFIENFNNPYTSTSITEFWRRWHMSLGRWMRDYLYIPLGGNQFSKSRMYLNLWIVFVVSGLWHGAAWNFIIWGAFHGLFLIADRIFLLKIYERIGKFPSILITYIITLLGWVLFRANSLTDAIDYIKSMFSLENRNTEEYHSNYFYFMLIIAFVFAFAAVSKNIEKAQLKFYEGNYSRVTFFWVSLLIISLLLISLSFVLSSDFNPFIYFRF